MTDKPAPKRRFRFSLKTLLVVVVLLGMILGITLPLVRSLKRDLEALAAVKAEGVLVVNALDAYYKVHGEFPGELRAAIAPPMTPLGRFNYEVYDANECYILTIYVSKRNANLCWYGPGGSWRMERGPYQ